jgi:hypothetical protein
VHTLYVRESLSGFTIGNAPPSPNTKESKRSDCDTNRGAPEPLLQSKTHAV